MPQVWDSYNSYINPVPYTWSKNKAITISGSYSITSGNSATGYTPSITPSILRIK